MTSLKITAALITLVVFVPAHAIYLTMPVTGGTFHSVRNKLSQSTQAAAPRSFLEASLADPEQTNGVPSRSNRLMNGTGQPSEDSLSMRTHFLPIQNGLIQYVPEPSTLVVAAFAGLLPFFRRRRH